MFVEITCDELDECFKIYVNTIGEDVALKFDTEEEMEKTWMWFRNEWRKEKRK